MSAERSLTCSPVHRGVRERFLPLEGEGPGSHCDPGWVWHHLGGRGLLACQEQLVHLLVRDLMLLLDCSDVCDSSCSAGLAELGFLPGFVPAAAQVHVACRHCHAMCKAAPEISWRSQILLHLTAGSAKQLPRTLKCRDYLLSPYCCSMHLLVLSVRELA